MDIQGADVARPYVEIAKAEYTTLVDSENLLGSQFGFKAIPLTILFDEQGRMIRGPKSANVSNPLLIAELEDWIENGAESKVALAAAELNEEIDQSSGFSTPEAEEYFLKGAELLRNGMKNEALEVLKIAFDMDPDNWIIRKQIWALENPDKFYEGDIDTRWQREILRKGKK